MHFIAVFLGGGLGATIRYLISFLLGKENLFLPYHTLIANFFGCFIAGIVMTYLSLKTPNPVYKSLIITGFCGGLTTFSTFSMETVEFLKSGEYNRAVLYIFTSLLISIISVILGITVVRKYV